MDCQISNMNNSTAIIDGQKIMMALHEISKSNFCISDDTILDKLYVHIVNSSTEHDIIDVLLPELGDWLSTLLNRWNDNGLFYGVQILAVRLIGFFGSTSKGFNLMKDKNILFHIDKLVSRIEIQNDSCLMVPLINAFGMFLKHQNGWKWVTETMIWKCTLKPCINEQSIYIRRAGIKFVSLLLDASSTYDTDVGTDILNVICRPLITNKILSIEVCKYCGKTNEFSNTDQEMPAKSHEVHQKHLDAVYIAEKMKISDELVRTAKFVSDILEDVIINDSRLPGNLILIPRSTGDDNVLIKLIQNACLSLQHHQIFSHLLVLVDLKNANKVICFKCGTGLNMLHTYDAHVILVVRSLISHNHLGAIINFCVMCLSWRSHIELKHSAFEATVVRCLTLFLQLHIYCFTDCPCEISFDRRKIYLEESVLGDLLINKVSKECLADLKKTQKLSLQYVYLGVHGLTRAISLIDRDNINIIFSDVVTTLKAIVHNFEQSQETLKPVLLNLLTLTCNIIEKHWFPYSYKNSEENIFMILIKMLGIKCKDVRVTVATLQLLDKMLRCHILPDLLWKGDLVPHTDARLQLCNLSILVFHLDSTCWEIRDTALEVLQTMIELAGLMPWFFIDPFQSDLLNKILLRATNDESAYVRASALQFFSMTVRGKLFENIITPSTLLDLAVKMFCEDEMPVGRRAATELLTALYISYTPGSIIDTERVYSAVFAAGSRELDWEVKRASIKFWRCVFDKLLADHSVPLNLSILYFCKIPTNQADIISRITAVLNILGQIGCLKAIWDGVNDDCDLKVAEEAETFVSHVEHLEKQWGFVKFMQNQDSIEVNKTDENNVRKLSSKQFLDLIQNQEWRQRLNARKNWIENTCDDLNSLLDHILNVDNRMGDLDRNAIDCY